MSAYNICPSLSHLLHHSKMDLFTTDTDWLSVPTADRIKVDEDGSGDYSKENLMIMSMAENSIKGV